MATVTAALEVEKTASQLLGILQGEDHWRACNQCRKAALTKALESVESLSTEKLFLTTQVEKQSAETHGQRARDRDLHATQTAVAAMA